MTQSIPLDWSNIIAVFVTCVTLLIGYFRWLDVSAKAKKDEKAEFIERIAEAAVNKTLDKVFSDQNSKIETLFNYRESDRRHWDERFDAVLNKLK
jgi:CHASE1-domain containing sensor protein